MSRNTLYDIKPKFVVALDGITSSLARRGVNPNAVTLLAIPVAVATGASLALGAVWAPAWFVVAPLCLFLMGINAVDGSLARATGQETRRGAVLNELVDRFGDVAILGSAFALVAPELAAVAIISVLAGEIVGLIGWGALRARALVGVMGKPDRALLVGVGATTAVFFGEGTFVLVFGVIAVGAAFGAVQRIVWVVRNAD